MKLRILFIGNSYTYFHHMPQILFPEKAAARGVDADVTAITRGGYRLSQFADPENEEGKRLREEIRGKKFDWVVLQDQSCNPIADREDFFRGVSALRDLLREQTGEFLLYATWCRRPGTPIPIFPEPTPEEMTRGLDEAYTWAGERLGMGVARVGKVFERYRADHPEEELYADDGSHPSRLGSELAAETILDAILAGTEKKKE